MGKPFRSTAIVLAVILLAASICAVAWEFSGANDVVMQTGLTNSVRASFYANRNTGSDPQWGAEPNSHSKQCYVRLIEGSYDSGRVYSEVASSTQDGVMKTAYTSKLNNPFHTCYLCYGWNQYF